MIGKTSNDKNSSYSITGKLWAMFACLLIFSLWPNLRPSIGPFEVHPAILLLPIILIAVLPFGSLYFKYAIKPLSFLLIFTFIMLLSSLFNINHLELTLLDRSLIKWIVFIFIIMLSTTTLMNRKNIILVLKVSVVSIGFLCFYGLIKWQGGEYCVNPFYFSTVNSLSNWTAGIFPICLILCLFFAVSLRERILFAMIFFIMTLAQVYTLNRSSWVIIVLSIASVFIFFLKIERKKIFFYVLVLVISFLLIMSQATEKAMKEFHSISSLNKIAYGTSFVDRVALGKKAFALFLKNPFLGVGPGQFESSDPKINISFIPQASHSIYLSVLSETGLLGSLSLFFFVFFLITRLWNVYKVHKNLEDRYIAFMLLLSVIMILIRGLTSHEIQFIPTSGLIFGLALRYSIMVPKSRRVTKLHQLTQFKENSNSI